MLVLLVVVVALAVGLSVASRNITNLKTATQTERSQRAFSAAEGGVEDVLSRLGSVTATIPVEGGSVPVSVDVGGIEANVTVSANPGYTSTINLGSVGQIDLNPLETSTSNVRIEWGGSGSPSIEVIEYYKNSGSYDQNRWYFVGGVGHPGESATSSSAVVCTPSAPYSQCVEILIQSPAQDFRILRIRPFYANADVKVTAVGFGSYIPLQTYTLESTARTDEGITRKVLVTRNSLPALPAAFDYALFSSGNITK